MQQARSAQAGFSLIELLVAVVILAVGLLGLAELQITATKANAQSDSILAASSLAQQVIEEIVAMDPDDAMFDPEAGFETTSNHISTDNASWTPASVDIPGAGTYNISYDVVTRFEGVTNLCQIVVRVTSDQAVMNVTGNKVRTVRATTIKRSS